MSTRPREAKRRKLSDEVAKVLLDQIRDRGLMPGARIPSERELMEQLGVGRSTIREVINGLAILGALDVRRGQGAFVLDPDVGRGSLDPIAVALPRSHGPALFEARRLIEVHTARLAADRRTEDDLCELVEILERHAEAVSDRKPSVDHAMRFHIRLASAARNDTLTLTVQCVEERLSDRGRLLHSLAGFQKWELHQHRAVLGPVCAGDNGRAAKRMSEHLDAEAGWHERLASSKRRCTT